MPPYCSAFHLNVAISLLQERKVKIENPFQPLTYRNLGNSPHAGVTLPFSENRFSVFKLG